MHQALNAQNEQDALRYSYTDQGGTPRSLAMGNAFGALGADMSSMFLNPAGLAFYRKMELGLGFGNEINQVDALHYGTETNSSLYNFNINNAGAVFTALKDDENAGPWKSTHFGVAYTRTGSYARDMNIAGRNPDSSLLMQFADQANGTPPEYLSSDFPFTSSLAWETYTIDPLDTLTNTYVSLFPNGNVNQEYSLESRGRMSETALAFAANYQHKLYLGGTIAFVSTRYEENYDHKETRVDMNEDLVEFKYSQDLLTTGSGINFRLGAIYRLNKAFRAGASIQSPSLMGMNDIWSTKMSSRFADGTRFENESPIGEFRWALNTPWRYTLSVASIIGSRGLISVDYEFMNSAGAKMKRSNNNFDDYDFDFENEQIDKLYTTSNQLRVGTEWKIRRLVLRGGFNMRQYPYKKEYTTQHDQVLGYSGGIGYRVRSLSIDLSYRRSQFFEDRYLYSPDLIEPSAVTTTRNEIILGVAFRY